MLDTLLVEPELPVDVRALMIAAQHEEVLWVADFEGKQKAHCLYALTTSIDIVSQKQEIGFRWVPTYFKDAEKILVLTVDVTAHVERRLELKKDRLTQIDLADFLAKPNYLCTCKMG
jgi:hypothetical protein